MPNTMASLLEAFFRVYDPQKVSASQALLEKYNGKEDSMKQGLEKKYNTEFFKAHEKALDILKKHDPDKARNIDALLEKYAKKEMELVTILQRKYGAGQQNGAKSGLEVFFKIFNPQNVGKAEQLAKDHAARLPDLHASLHRKYETNFFKIREALFQVITSSTNPASKSVDIDAILLAKFKSVPGKDLIAAIQKKYGSATEAPTLTFKERLTAFYKAYCPEKLGKEDALLEKYKGQEPVLMEAMVARYGPEPENTKQVKVLGEKPPEKDWEKRIRDYYTIYDPQKAGNAKNLVEKYRGNEPELWKQIVAKYGPEPYWTERVLRLTDHHKTGLKRDVINKKLIEYAGREQALLSLLESKYGPEPTQEEERPSKITTAGKIHRMYYQYNPNKMDSVPSLLNKYKGKETDLYSALKEKYGPDALDVQPNRNNYRHRVVNLYCMHDAVQLGNVEKNLKDHHGAEEAFVKTLLEQYGGEEPHKFKEANPFKERLVRFYEKYNKDKIPSAGETLKKYEGHEEELFEALVKKYGEEPADPSKKPKQDSEEVRLIKYYYMQHKPYEYCNIPAVLEEWEGREPELVKVLQESFGDECPELNPFAERIVSDLEENIDPELNHLERCARWRTMEEQDSIRGDLKLIETDECITARQQESERILTTRSSEEHLKIAFRRWIAFLSEKICATCEDRDRLMAGYTVYEQMHTNKYSMAAKLREVRSQEKKKERERAKKNRNTTVQPRRSKNTDQQGHFSKSTAELRFLYEKRKVSKTESEDLYHTPPKPTRRSPMKTYPTRLASPSPPRTPRTPHRPRPESLHQAQAARVQAAKQSVTSAYPSPDADFYALTLQQVTGTPETLVERELRLRRERVLST
eukprot:TRINITY_DN18175_c0_g1_i1.p1 TRINITY_DN18175_c0_g1~~TRINITY_DN18175_c0_g1_i1.p1  ORF type:complete len:864 (+),score=183.29 TRINITY_DN18175_c0_g1_i1:84-2675(+)